MTQKNYRLLLDGSFLLVAGFLLFARLGNYALWDDEAMVALASQGILSSGDTRAVVGDNLVAYRSGLLLQDQFDRSTPPLTSFLTAPSIAFFGPTSFAARFPWALLGFFFMALVVLFARKTNTSSLEAFAWYIAVVGNTSLFLFLRQCRYFAITIFLVTLIIWIYLYWNRFRQKNLAAIILLFGILFSANYMICLALFICLAVDYIVWKRKTTPFPQKTVLPWGLVSAGFCLWVSSIWNPYKTGLGAYAGGNSWSERIKLFMWNFRDAADCQFWITGLLLAGLLLAAVKKDEWLFRGLTVLVVFNAVISIVSPQLVAATSVADIRYLAPLIPLGIALSVRSFLYIFQFTRHAVLFLALPIFWTNLVGGAFFGGRPLRCPLLEFLGELTSPNSDPYTVASDWIRAQVPKKSSVWVVPDYMTYPLMFHAPEVLYAWQLDPEQKKLKQFSILPDIHFRGVVPPDFIVVFGPSVVQIRQLIGQWSMQGLRYQEVARLMTFWKDLYRPELFWRSFKPIENFDPNTEAIYIFQRQS